MSPLRRVNLNLLPILRELLRQKSVTSAARALNMSQPACSDALSRLRHLLGDQILVGRGRGYVLSPFAEELVQPLERALGEMEALIVPHHFDPAQSRGVLKIATADYAGLLLGPLLLAQLERLAPGVTIEFLDVTSRSPEQLRGGEIDLIICPAGLDRLCLDGFATVTLFKDEIVCLVDRHSEIESILSQSEFVRRKTILFGSLSDDGASFVESELRLRHQPIGHVVRVTSFLLMPFLVEDSPNVAFVQRRLAERMVRATRTKLVLPPFRFPELDIKMAWSASNERDALHSWLRDLMMRTFQVPKRRDLP